MKKIWVNVANSFEEADAFDQQYYSKLTPEERLTIVQELREQQYKFQPEGLNEDRKRLRRSIRVLEQEWG